jgi:hypothetical protein
MFKHQFLLLSVAIVIGAAPAIAAAQTMEDSPSLTFEAPFGAKDAGDAEATVNSTRDASFNKIVTSSPGWGSSASAIGNLINVVEQGSNNTVIINASQINSGSQKAIVAAPTPGYLAANAASTSSRTSSPSAAPLTTYSKN